MIIPEKYIALLKDKGATVLSVIAKDGTVQSSLVWSDFEDGLISINMLTTAPKYESILRTEKATVLKVDPANEDNYISIRCSLLRVESTGAIAHLDKLTQRHMGVDSWYGAVVPETKKSKNTGLSFT